MNQHCAMPHITVESPVTHNSWEDGKYTTYDIVINCEDDSCPLFAVPRSTVSRRYREFRWLRKRLCSVSSPMVRRVPMLPTVGCPLFDDRFSPEFIERRRRGLEEFLQGVCAIPTLLSEAALHLFVQTDLSVAEIDAYVNRKWGRQEEVCDVVVTLNRQKKTEERDEIASLASLGRWSEASLLDLEDDVLSNESATSSANKRSSSSGSGCWKVTATKSQPRLMASNARNLADSHVVSPVLGLYLPPDDVEAAAGITAPVSIRTNQGRERDVGSSVPAALESGRRRRSKSVQIRIPNDGSVSSSSSFSPMNQNQHLHPSSSFSPTGQHDDEVVTSPTSLDIYNRRRRGKSPAPGNNGRTLPYYCSNAVWLSSAAANTGSRLPPATVVNPRRAGSQTSSLSPPSVPSSLPSSSLSNGGRS